MITEQAILNIRYQTALAEQRNAEIPRNALEAARHALVVLNGLIAAELGTMANPDAHKNTCFRIDNSNEIAAIDEALRNR